MLPIHRHAYAYATNDAYSPATKSARSSKEATQVQSQLIVEDFSCFRMKAVVGPRGPGGRVYPLVSVVDLSSFKSVGKWSNERFGN